MLSESLTGVFAGLESLSAGAGILVSLGILSVWVWTLIILTSLALYEATHSAKEGIVIEHEKFCRSLSCCKPGGKLRLRVIQAHMELMLRQVSKNVGTILLLSSLAPLIGLLGTVEGMICTFRALAEAGASSTALTEGVSQALVTTQGGLLVAIPSLLAGAVLRRKTQKLRNALRSASLRVDNEGQDTVFYTEGHNEMA